MVHVTYHDPNGQTHTLDIKPGLTVMEGAVRNGVAGIDADCGGACACATCHVYIDAAWADKVGAPAPMEQSMLDFAEGVTPQSRLSCQVTLTAELDGLVVRIPASQA